MSPTRTMSWRDVRTELLRRINERLWRPGEPIPKEADLAIEFNCARATVNRAMRDLADEGLVERKRRAGTRVALNPVTRAMLNIPILREEIEAQGFVHRHVLLERDITHPPSARRHRLDLPADAPALHILTLHLADGRAYALDDRWINLLTVPDAASVDLTKISPNEWLVQHAPYTHGDMAITAEHAPPADADHLGIPTGKAILVLERTTWKKHQSITTTRLAFPPGYRLCSRPAGTFGDGAVASVVS